MTLTNNSFGFSNFFGVYDASSSFTDKQLNDSANLGLLHVLISHNGGNAGFKTVSSGWATAKNVLTVGSTNDRDEPSLFSGKGPVNDGRLKPEVVGVGEDVTTLAFDNDYTGFTGTSASAPGVTGTLALLYERYADLGRGQVPDAALMKALICNTADDIANPGPDYITGFGRINARRAVEALEENFYFTNTLSQGQSFTHAITVPPGTGQLRVMLYWDDKEAAEGSTINLVNNLDLKVSSTSSDYLPWILNPSVPSTDAVRGVDNLNNIEQVTIDNPSSGVYSIKVMASSVPFGPESYFIVYEIVKPHIIVTYPYGGESLKPGETTLIRWDSYGSGNVTVQYSLNDDSGFKTIASDIPASQKFVQWIVPDVTAKGIVRVTDGTLVGESVREFNILPVPSGLSATNSSATSILFTWNEVPDASSYEVYLLSPSDKLIQSKGITNDRSFTFENLMIGLDYWMSVRAITATGIVSERANAIKKRVLDIPISCRNTGTITRDLWVNVPGDKVSDIPGRQPDCSMQIQKFEAPSNFADKYAQRLRGYLCIDITGEYTFWISSNDQSELWLSTDENPAHKRKIAFVPGFTAIHEWQKYPSQKSAPIRLEANKSYYIEALHKEGVNLDHVEVGWQRPDGSFERPIPGSRLAPYIDIFQPMPEHGLLGVYYDELQFEGPFITRVDPEINFNFGTGSPSPCMDPDKFSVRWTGQVLPQFSQEYTFYTTSNDGVRLFVNGVKLIDNFTDHPPVENKGSVFLNGGQRYTIVLEYYEAMGTALINLSWSSASQRKQIIPTSRLFPDIMTSAASSLAAEDSVSEQSLEMFPNPADKQINIVCDSIDEENITVLVVNLYSGNADIKLEHFPVDKKMITVDVSKLQPGFYEVKVITDRKIKSQKLQILR
jgi:hypothetical protein